MRLDPETGKLVPAVSGEELVGMLRWPEAPPLELDEFARVPSFDVHGDLALALAERVAEQCARDDVAGVVVTHGTDTMEESVYTVDRLHDSEKPVAFTGAQRGADEPDTDGPRNLRNAIQVALAPQSSRRGALVVFAGEVHGAREVRKVHTSALKAFGSPGYGPLGHVDGQQVSFRRRPDRSPPLPHPEGPLPQVDLIRLYAGSDDRFLRSSLESGSRAIVLEATGRGNANERGTSRRRGGRRGGCSGGRLLALLRGAGGARVRARRGQGPGRRRRPLRRRPRRPEGTRPPAARARRRRGPVAGPCCGGRMTVRVEVRQKEVSPCPY